MSKNLKKKKQNQNRFIILNPLFMNFILLPFRLAWDIIVVIGTIALEITWLGFIFGSVLGVVLMLIFLPDGFLLPLGLFGFCVDLRPED